jgi:hypothetical protein
MSLSFLFVLFYKSSKRQTQQLQSRLCEDSSHRVQQKSNSRFSLFLAIASPLKPPRKFSLFYPLTDVKGLCQYIESSGESLELGEKVVDMYHCEREVKRSPISLASALELVQNKMKKQHDQDSERETKFAHFRSERSESYANLQAKAKQELLGDELEQRALLRLNVLSNLMPTLMQQIDSQDLTSTPDLVKHGYRIVDEMIAQSGLNDI